MVKIYSWNVNGIRAVIKKGEFDAFLEVHQPDILCLQETKAKQDQVSPNTAGYLEFWNPAEKAGYSGTAIFSRQEPLQVMNGMPDALVAHHGLADDSYGNPNLEGRVISAEFPAFWLVTVYTPNAKGDLSRLPLRYHHWEPAFLDYVRSLESGAAGYAPAKPVVFCGDLNVAHLDIDIYDPASKQKSNGFTPEERERFSDIINAGFVDSFRQLHPDVTEAYTWWDMRTRARPRNAGWRIDYVVLSAALASHLRRADIHADQLGSDHCPISIDLDV